MNRDVFKTLSIITIFAVAMAYLESAVVIYIRKLYYPAGFEFPLKGFIDPNILNIEILREVFTIVMLVCIAILASKKGYERFAYFFYSFAVWDIFYYIWLKVSVDWPSSLLTWDVLFLIPWTWASPLLAPIISSLTMIFLSTNVLSLSKKHKFKIIAIEWILLVLGALLQLYTFLYDYGKIALSEKGLSQLSTYIPTTFNWPLYFVGEFLILFAIVSWHFKTIHSK